MIRKNRDDGVFVSAGTVVLRGGAISENKSSGLLAADGAKVTVTTEQDDLPQTVSKDNGVRKWCAESTSKIIGIPREMIRAYDYDNDNDAE